jgi:hypothetical protein
MFDKRVSTWLSWEEQVDIAESPVYVENNFRIAFTSPEFEPRQTDLTLASGGVTPGVYPNGVYVLGVTPPINRAVVTSVTGGAPPTISRVYLYTFVTQWGEESAPSPASDLFSGNASGAWNITLPDTAPPNVYTISDIVYISGKLRITLDTVFGLREKETIAVTGADTTINKTYRITSVDAVNKYVFITTPNPGAIIALTGAATRLAPHNATGMTKNVYRSITTAEGTQFYLVGSNIAVATTTFIDDATIIGEPIPSIGWVMPPANLEGIVVHPSGTMIGFVGNQVYLSEPYAPYAWPTAYVSVLDFPVVAIGISGQSAVVGTTGKPYVIPFSDPATATPQRIDQNWPCLAKEGVASFGGGVYFPTTIGLAYIGDRGNTIVTKSMYAQRDWNNVNPSTFKAGHYDDQYYAIYETQNAKKIIVISETYGVIQINIAADAIFTDRQTGQAYIARDKKIRQLNAFTEGFLEYTWTSKVHVLPEPINLGVAKLEFNSALNAVELASINTLNAAIAETNAVILAGSNFDGLVGADEVIALAVADSIYEESNDITLANYCAFTLLVDQIPVYSVLIRDTEAFRLPAGFKYDNFSIRLSGTAQITSAVIGTTSAALKAV